MPNNKTATSVGVAMSGGVDSTVTAATLLEQGYIVHGFFMKLPLPGLDEQIRKVQAVADQLGIPLHFVEVKEDFKQKVIAYFCDAYRQGLTPNPCVVCNRGIKFGLLSQTMLAQGMKKTATGHYAGVEQREDTALLRRGKDPEKDQSYFLCRLAPEQLRHSLFPLADRHKEDIFLQAKGLGFTQFNGEESQDVCFLAQQDLSTFLGKQGAQGIQGKVVTNNGEVLGTHEGIWKYTVGQRRGLGIPDATPWYVVGLNAEKNHVIIGKNNELFQTELHLSDMQWQLGVPLSWQGKVQLRSRHQAAEAEVCPEKNGTWQVSFKNPQRAVTPGQFAVLYQDDLVVGSGVIIP
jgi:tRNA-specific 2-thiouridylase